MSWPLTVAESDPFSGQLVLQLALYSAVSSWKLCTHIVGLAGAFKFLSLAMSSQSVEEETEVAPVLTASVHDLRYFASLLRGVSLAHDTRATFIVTHSGFTVTVEEARTLLARAYVVEDMFDEYVYQPEVLASQELGSQPAEPANTAFEVRLATLLDCLNIFGTAGRADSVAPKHQKILRREDEEREDDARARRKSAGGAAGSARIDQFFGAEKGTALRLSYAGPGHPLTLLIAEESDGPTATCEVTTFDPEAQLDLPFDVDRTMLKIILKSSWLRDALSELDPSCEKVTIIGNPPPEGGRATRNSQPTLRLQAEGTFGSTEMDYPNDKEVLETCECAQRVSFSYKFAHITRALKALQASTKTSLRIDEDGLLSLQFIVASPKPRGGGRLESFIEFSCLPLVEDT
ncbi:Rad1-domain-containing protein [Obba rivulosa]|uniref:Rad1-domain-containing protein n=1 Tax=Obba rivulosa TaxID=1052685 RepID=A0A8E2DJI7_9APHY|nr:Rad1-domain-containing protein [Obba rivulosa]